MKSVNLEQKKMSGIITECESEIKGVSVDIDKITVTCMEKHRVMV